MKENRLDDATTMFFERELESIKSRTYDVIKAPLRGMELVPVESSAGEGAESIVYHQFDSTGVAKIIANYADDLPRADVKGKEFVARVRTVGDSYGYSYDEILNARHAGKSLDARKSAGAVKAQQELWNRVLFYGDETHTLQGWLTNPNIPSDSVEADGDENGGTDSTEFQHKTATQIIRDMNALVNGIFERTNGAEKPDTLVLPIKQYTLISTTNAGTGTDTTVLEYFLRNSPFVKSVEWANELSATQLAANGITDFTGDIMIAYERSPEKLTFEFPSPFKQLPVETRGLEYIVPCHSRIAGVIIYYPFSMAIGEGI